MSLIDDFRVSFAQDSSISPSRTIEYVRQLDSVSITMQSFIGLGLFNKVEKDTLGRFQSFGSLPLSVAPRVNDIVIYDGISWKVIRYTKMGNLYTVYCENKFHNGKPQ